MTAHSEGKGKVSHWCLREVLLSQLSYHERH